VVHGQKKNFGGQNKKDIYLQNQNNWIPVTKKKKNLTEWENRKIYFLSNKKKKKMNIE